MKSFQKGVAATRTQGLRDTVFLNLTKMASSPVALQKTRTVLGASSPFSHCINVSGTNDCTNGAATDFALYDAGGTQVAGTSSAPIRYSVDGAVCASASNVCSLEAVSSFSAICAGGASTCDQAAQLSVSIDLHQSASVTTPAGGVSHIGKRTLASTVDTALIASGGAQSCPTNQAMTGIDATGGIVCSPATQDHFGGAWACRLNTTTLNCGPCLSINPMTGSCSCPSGYQTLKVTGCDATLYRCGFVCAK